MSCKKTQLPLFSIPKNKRKITFYYAKNYTLDYTLQPKPWISIQVKGKLNVRVQSVTIFII